ncbi:MAG: hypothetical protein ACTSU3_03770 [Candidatus Thorarchaeota archaeon]
MRITHKALLAVFVCGLIFGLGISNSAVELRFDQRLEPMSSTRTASVVWDDDFDDGNMDGWTTWAVYGGTVANFTVEDGIVYCHDNQINLAGHESAVAYGTWSFDIFIEGTQYSAVHFITGPWQNGSLDYPDGYRLHFSIETNFGMIQSGIHLVSDDDGQLAFKEMNPSGWHHTVITRTDNGHFCVYVDDSLMIQTIDNGITSSEYFGFSFEEDTECGFDNITVSNSLDIDEAPPYFLQQPTDQVSGENSPFNYQLNATDQTEIDRWWVNDTANFDVYVGSVTSVGALEIGVYGLEVFVNDTLGNTESVEFSVTVGAVGGIDVDPMLVTVAVVGVLVVVIVLVIFLKKRP